jgi:hypothetical protein
MHGAEPGSAGSWDLESSQNQEQKDQPGRWVINNAERRQKHYDFNTSSNYNPIERSAVTRKSAMNTDRRNNFGMERANTIDFARLEANAWDDDLEEDMFSKDEISNLTVPQFDRESTITDSERYAFQRIFSDIFARNQQSGVPMSSDDVFTEEDSQEAAEPKDRKFAKLKLANILSHAMTRGPLPREEMENIVNQYPPALQTAAARAIGLTGAKQEISEEEVALDTEELETLRGPERLRVETLMKAARTDFELWEIIEKEVFSLIPKLGLENILEPVEELPVKETKKKKNASKKSKKAKSKGAEEATHEITAANSLDPCLPNIEIENGISPLALYGPLYPSYLLLGLRLLDRSFAKPSPLTLSILPKIKSLGLISQVLGATTQLYNELLRVYRYRYDDYRRILNLLEEMEHSGLDFDEETLEIVHHIRRAQASVRNGEKGPALQALWNLPEFAPQRFGVWRERIVSAINEKNQNGGGTLRY